MQSPLDREQRIRIFEEFEQRLVMTANAVGGLGLSDTIDPQVIVDGIERQAEVTTLGHIDSQPEVSYVHEEYGFRGTGQTVAVIDSGIAWDHYALGGGFGENHRVVGGWDFAENDANPYDDGPAGYHGTHVAGIIGSDEASNSGVSPDVDLVALRVFDDAGNGNLDWVEDALRWVHENRTAFENPITTVNLSLGTEWNADTVPDWGELEDEFAQLEADGIFISVAAGNAYKNYNTNGLSYPAVSDHVVPVASHGPDGQLSDFSQRDDGVLVAPGESIRSTVPDHLFGSSSRDRFLGSTGTSMSAPYVAGASAILRQANEFMGNVNISQDLLYQQFLDSADRLFDAGTNSFFYKVNLDAAIDQVVRDTVGDSWFNASQIELDDNTALRGTIGKSSDIDVYSFTATQSGTYSLTIDTTHDLDAAFTLRGGNARLQGNVVSFDVVAGQSYQFSIESEKGIGHFEIQSSFSQGIDSIDLGSIDQGQFRQFIASEETFRVTSANDGFVTFQTHSQSPVTIEVYDSKLNLVGTQSSNDGTTRVNAFGKAGENYFVKIKADNVHVDLNVTNLVSLRDGELTVNGTRHADQISVVSKDGLQIDVNGVSYSIAGHAVDQVRVSGGAGTDHIQVGLHGTDDQIHLMPSALKIANSDFEFQANGFESIETQTGSGYDHVFLFDSAGDDVLRATENWATLQGEGFSNKISGYERLAAKAYGGEDTLFLYGSQDSDRISFHDGYSYMSGQAATVSAAGFELTRIDGRGGLDVINLRGSASADEFHLSGTTGSVIAQKFQAWVQNISRINAIGGENDTLHLQDTAGDDVFDFQSGAAGLHGDGYRTWSRGFENISVSASAGYDTAQIVDTEGNDVFTAWSGLASMTNRHLSVTVEGFDRVNAISSSGGFDTARLIGTQLDDTLVADVESVSVKDGFDRTNRAVGFDQVSFDGRSGSDRAFLEGSAGNESYVVEDARVRFESAMQELGLENVEASNFNGNGGIDEAIFGDFEELDLLAAVGDKAIAYLESHTATAQDIDLLQATANSGHNADYDIDAVDYLYMLKGKWDQV